MPVQILCVPYDSGHRARRMGRGPLHLLERGLVEHLRRVEETVSVVPIETNEDFLTEIGTQVALNRATASAVQSAAAAGDLPLVLSGNCNSAAGTVCGLRAADPTRSLGVIWFDGHGDCNTPATFTGTFLDAMGLSTLTGHAWPALYEAALGFSPLPEEDVVLVGAHGADPGALRVLSASTIAHVPTDAVRTAGVAAALNPALRRMAARGVERVYVHLDVDVLDAAWAPANPFAPTGGLSAAELLDCIAYVAGHIPIAAAAVASYDPGCDRADRILGTAMAALITIVGSYAGATGPLPAPSL